MAISAIEMRVGRRPSRPCAGCRIIKSAPLLKTLVTLLSGVAIAAQAQTPQFRASVHTVAIYATVRDANRRLLTDLTAADFQVLDNGRPTRTTSFSNDVVPITTVLLLDMSATMMPLYFQVQSAATAFVSDLMPNDRVRIGTMADEVSLSPLLTGDRDVLTRILREELWPGNSTPLWAGMQLSMESLAKESGRKVVLVVTDGDDFCMLHIQDSRDLGAVQRRQFDAERKSGCVPASKVRDTALDGEFMLYAVGLNGSGLSAELSEMIDATGGGAVQLQAGADIAAALEAVANELHHQYLIGIAPVADGKRHAIQVRVNRPGVSVQARKSYLVSQ